MSVHNLYDNISQYHFLVIYLVLSNDPKSRSADKITQYVHQYNTRDHQLLQSGDP